jgi:cytochrome c
MFTAENLARFRAVVFLDTTGSPLNAAQEAAFEDYFHAGGSFVGVGSAVETERFEYVKGLRAPVAVLSASPTDGQDPLTVAFSSAGSADPDPGDSIRFEWDFDGNGTVDSVDPSPTFTYTTRGVFVAKLTVTDSSGKAGAANTTITVGNTSPTVTVTTPVAGGTFAFGDIIPYTVLEGLERLGQLLLRRSK